MSDEVTETRAAPMPARDWTAAAREAAAGVPKAPASDVPASPVARGLAVRRAPGALPAQARRDMVAEVTAAAGEDAADGARLRVSFSSEQPVRRVHWEAGPFWEVLGHGAEEADLRLLNGGAAPVLADHEPRLAAQMGIVERAWLEEGRGHAVLRFGAGAAAQELLARVRAGEVRSVSVGYDIEAASEAGARDGLPVVRITRWVPREISFVAIPADPTVGYGRAAGPGAGVVTVETFEQEGREMPETETRAATAAQETETRAAPAAAPQAAPAAAGTEAGAVRAAAPVDREAIRREERAAALHHLAEVRGTAEHLDLPRALVERAERGELTLDQFRAEALRHMASEDAAQGRLRRAEIGLSERERQSFSFVRLVRHLANPTERSARDAAFELDVVNTAAETRGNGGGLSVPVDVLAGGFGQRDQATGTAGEGGALVGTDLLAGSFIDALRARMVMAQAGVTMLPGLVGNVDIPKQTGESTETWLGEGDTGTNTTAAFGTVPLTPHTISVAVPITRRLMLQSTPSIEQLVRQELVSRIALGIQKAAIPGSGDADAPTALRAALVSGGLSLDWDTADTPTWGEIVALEAAVVGADADLGAMAYIYSGATSGALKTTKLDAGSGRFVEEMGEVNGYPRFRCNQVATPEVFFGAWNQLIVGMWSGLDLEVDRATLTASGGVVLRAFQDVDVAVRHVESFSHIANA